LTSIAIMQPTYLPWLGYFSLIDAVDIFVLLDTVQFDRRSWQQRNRLKGPCASFWITIPVKKASLEDSGLSAIEIVDGGSFAVKHARSIELNYSRAQFYDGWFESQILSLPKNYLTGYTVPLIKNIAAKLGVKTPIHLASDIQAMGDKEELLRNICVKLECDNYIAVPGAKAYMLESRVFSDADISVSYFEFQHPTYLQCHGDFISHMSILDAVYNCGWERTAQLMKRGVLNP